MRPSPLSPIRSLLSLLLLAGLWTCGGSEVTGPDGAVAVLVTPATLALAAGRSAALTASVRTRSGAALDGRDVAWRSGDTLVARVSATGMVTGVGAGTTRIIATADGVEGAGEVTVTDAGTSDTAATDTTVGMAASIRLTPDSASLLTGQSLVLHAEVLDRRGAPVAGATVRWTTSDSAVVAVSAAGRIDARTPGGAIVTARADSAHASVHLSVAWGAVALHDVAYCAPGGVVQRMDVYTPATTVPRPVPLVLHLHGGSWQFGGKAQAVVFAELRDSLLARGVAVATLDYRLAPTYRWPAQIEDAKCAVRSFRANAARWGIDSARIGAWGESAGGQLAALLALTDASAGLEGDGGFPGVSSRVRVAATINAVTDLTRPGELAIGRLDRVFRTWPDSTSAELRGASPVAQVSADDSPILLLQSADDTLVSPAQAAGLADRLHAVGGEAILQPIAHADHGLESTGAPIDPSVHGIVRLMVDFLERRLR